MLKFRVRTDVGTDSGPNLVQCRLNQCLSIFIDITGPTIPVTQWLYTWLAGILNIDM